jgi:hypothetical protein
LTYFLFNEINIKVKNKYNLLKMQNQNQITCSYFGCSLCGKKYKTTINLNKHKILCDTLTRAKKKNLTEDFVETEPIPTQKQMYKIILDLSLKCNYLEEKVENMQKWVDRRKKKLNIIDWLQKQEKPEKMFEEWYKEIFILKEEIEILLHNSFTHIFTEIIQRIFTLYTCKETLVPIYASVDKPNILYIYKNQKWIEASKEDILELFKQIHFQMVKAFLEDKKRKEENISESDSLADVYNKANIKLMSINWREEETCNKFRTILYNKIKSPSNF